MAEFQRQLDKINDENLIGQFKISTVSARRPKLKNEPGLKIRNVNSPTPLGTSRSRSLSMVKPCTKIQSSSPPIVRYPSRSPYMTSSVSTRQYLVSSLNRPKSKSPHRNFISAPAKLHSMRFRSRTQAMTSPSSIKRSPVKTRIVERATIAVIGDPKIGKTTLLLSYLNKRFTVPDKSECFETYKKIISFSDNLGVQLNIWDFPGTELFDRFRPLGYADAKFIIICFQIDNTETLTNVCDRWIPEVMTHCSTAKRIMVGIGSEARADKTKEGKTLDYEYCLKFAHDLNCDYFECTLVQSATISIIFDKVAASLLDTNKKCRDLTNKEINKAMRNDALYLEKLPRKSIPENPKRITSYNKKKYSCIIS